jgi:hypothetical protein
VSSPPSRIAEVEKLKQSVNWYIATGIALLTLFVLTIAACSQSAREPAKEGVCPTSAPIKRTINPIDAPKYNKDATPVIPPDYSRSVSIWRDGVPATPVACGPQITDYPERPFAGSLVLLERLGCAPMSPGGHILECGTDSPLVSLDCDTLSRPFELVTGLDPAYPVVAECWHYDLDHRHLYLAGCIARVGVGYVFEINGEYVLADAAETIQELFVPIDSTDEALSYAQMLTGLRAMFAFQADYDVTMFYQEVVEGSHATETDEGYVAHLYHQQVCGCDTFVTSQVDIIVKRDGSVTWGDVEPTYVEFRPWCVD